MRDTNQDGCRAGVLALESWAGRSNVRVTVLSESIRHYRIRFEEYAFRHRIGAVKRVPKSAVTLVPQDDAEPTAAEEHGQ